MVTTEDSPTISVCAEYPVNVVSTTPFISTAIISCLSNGCFVFLFFIGFGALVLGAFVGRGFFVLVGFGRGVRSGRGVFDGFGRGVRSGRGVLVGLAAVGFVGLNAPHPVCLLVGSAVVGRLVGFAVVGVAVVGATVVGRCVVGSSVGSAVGEVVGDVTVGFAVVGLAVVGLAVVGRCVVGLFVTGDVVGSLVGASVSMPSCVGFGVGL